MCTTIPLKSDASAVFDRTFRVLKITIICLHNYETNQGVTPDNTYNNIGIYRAAIVNVQALSHICKFDFTGHANDLRRMRMSKNYIRILGSKSSPNMRGDSEASLIARGSRF